MKKKKEKIAVDKAFQMMNMFLNHPCVRYAFEIHEALPRINQIALYYQGIRRNLSGSEKAIVELFLREHQKILELLPVYMKRTPYRGLEMIC
jgi:hypothetical protein